MKSYLKAITWSIAMHIMALAALTYLSPWPDNPSQHSASLTKVKLVKSLLPDSTIVDLDDMRHISNSMVSSQFLSDKNRRVGQQTQARQQGLARRGEHSYPQSNQAGYDKPNLELPRDYLLRDSQSQMLSSISPSNYLPEIAMGDETLLNTQEYVYASFFVRMKRQMEAVWDPRSIINRESLARDFYLTGLHIILRQDGYVERLRIIASSGNNALDQEAILAVEKGAPYLNPPQPLLASDGKIHIPRWNFIVTRSVLF